MALDCSVLILTGTCGSGKSTVAELLAWRPGWCRISEDEIWPRHFGKNRGTFSTPEHRAKRSLVHQEVLARVRAALQMGQQVVLEATVHEAPPEGLEEYRSQFGEAGIAWRLCVLHPRLEVAVARSWHAMRGGPVDRSALRRLARSLPSSRAA